MNGDIEIAVDGRHLTLAELVRDPLVGLVMKSDGVERGTIETLFARITRAQSKPGVGRGSVAIRRAVRGSRAR